MKATFLIAASLIVGTAAIAQTTTPDASTSTPTDSTAGQMGTTTGTGGTSTTGANTMPAPRTADTANYPVCSRTVQDNCIQRQAARRRR